MRGKRRYKVQAVILALLLTVFLGILLYQQSVKYRQKLAADYKRQGRAYLQNGYFEEASSELLTSIKFNPSDSEAYYLLGRSYASLGEIKSALIRYQKAVELDPQNPEFRYSLALAYQEAGQRPLALKEVERSFKLLPDFLGNRLFLVNFYTEQGDIDRVIEQHQQIEGMDASPNVLADFKINLAKLYLKKGKKDQARLELEKVLEIDPGNRLADYLLRELLGEFLVTWANLPLKKGDFRRETKTPVSKITSPVENEVLTDTSYRITGTAEATKGYVAQVEVSTDGGNTWRNTINKGMNFSNWVSYQSLPIVNKRSYTISSRATDVFGNIEYPGDAVKVIVDNLPPTTAFSSNPALPDGLNGWHTKVPTIILSTLESTAITFYRWNYEDYQIYTSAFKAPEGENILFYYSKDSAGNIEKEQKYLFKVDATPPSVISTYPGPGERIFVRKPIIRATFDGQMLTESISRQTVLLYRGRDKLASKVSYDQRGRRLILTPSLPLGRAGEYTVVIKGGRAGVKDKAGSSPPADYRWNWELGSIGNWGQAVDLPIQRVSIPASSGNL